MRAFVVILSSLVLFTGCTSTGDPAAELANALAAVREATALGQAGRIIEELQRAATAAEKKKAPMEASFYRAAAAQTAAQVPTNPDPLGSRDEAIAEYEKVLAIDPNSPGALNNLAQLEAQRNPQRAEELFRHAIAVESAERARFQLNYADFLFEQQRAAEALRVVEDVAARHSTDDAVRERLVRFAASLGENSTLVPTLRKRLESGAVAEVAETAVIALQHPEAASAVEALLLLLADALAQRPHDPETFLAEADGPGPSALRELVRLREGAAPPNEFSFWREDTSTNRGEPGPRSLAFRRLARHLADGYAAAGDFEKAEQYYLLAADFDSDSSDPDAIVSLADLYFSQNRISDLAAMASKYEQPLFRGKGGAISRDDLAGQYRFHRALGILYGELERWGPESNPASAVYQLRRMRNAAQRFNSRRRGEEALPFDARVAALLARGYKELRKPAASLEVRTEAAHEYIDARDLTSAAEVVAPVERQDITAVIAADPQAAMRFVRAIERLPPDAAGPEGEKLAFTASEIEWIRAAAAYRQRQPGGELPWLAPIPALPLAPEQPVKHEPIWRIAATLADYETASHLRSDRVDAALRELVVLSGRVDSQDRRLLMAEMRDLQRLHASGDSARATAVAARALGRLAPRPPVNKN